MALLLLAHVPPDDGDSVVVKPTHIEFVPVILTTGLGVTVITISAVQPELVSVNRNVAAPAETPVTTFPTLVAIAGVIAAHVPPEAGDNVVVVPIQIVVDAADTVGGGLIVTGNVVLEHPVVVFVNVNVTDP